MLGPPSNQLIAPVNTTTNGTSIISCPKNFLKLFNGSVLASNATSTSPFDMCRFQRPAIRILPAEEFLE